MGLGTHYSKIWHPWNTEYYKLKEFKKTVNVGGHPDLPSPFPETDCKALK